MGVTITYNGATESNMMHLSNHNFYCLFSALGLNPQSEAGLVGEESAKVIYNLCKNLNLKNLLEQSYTDNNFIHQGRTLEQVTRYKWNLMKLASEAIKDNQPIYWA